MKKNSNRVTRIFFWVMAFLSIVGICSLMIHDPAKLGKTLLILFFIATGVFILYKFFSPSPYKHISQPVKKRKKRKRPSHLHVINGGKKGRR